MSEVVRTTLKWGQNVDSAFFAAALNTAMQTCGCRARQATQIQVWGSRTTTADHMVAVGDVEIGFNIRNGDLQLVQSDMSRRDGNVKKFLTTLQGEYNAVVLQQTAIANRARVESNVIVTNEAGQRERVLVLEGI